MIGWYVGKPIGGFPLDGNAVLQPVAGVYTITGSAAVFRGYLALTAGSYTLSGQAALFKATMPVTAGSYAITGNAAPLRTSLPAATGSYAITGATALFATRMPVAAGSYAITGRAVSLAASMPAAVGAYTLTGISLVFNTTLHQSFLQSVGFYVGAGIGGVIVQSDAADATYRITGQSASFTATEGISAGSYTLTGNAQAFTVTLHAEAGAYGITGYPATDPDDTIDSVMVLRGGTDSDGDRKRRRRRTGIELRLADRKVTVTDADGKQRKVSYTRRFAPPLAVPEWALPAPQPILEAAPEPLLPAPLPASPFEVPLPAYQGVIDDMRDEEDILAFMQMPDPLIADIALAVAALSLSGQLEKA